MSGSKRYNLDFPPYNSEKTFGDTAWHILEDKRDIFDLPLCANGVFRDHLASTLKSNKDDLLLKFQSHEVKVRKRKSDNDASTTGPNKAKTNFEK